MIREVARLFEHGVGLRDPLFFIGVIEKNDDPRKEGRVKVRAFNVHGFNDQVGTDDLPWALVCQGDYNPNNIPKVNSWVFGVFLDGRDAQEPMVLGLIPTQYTQVVDPKKNGYGYIPDRDANEKAHGSAPHDVTQPQQSRKLRGEDIQETDVLVQEMGRTLNVKVGGTDDKWDEPATAFNTEYPHNKVIETANHSIELDDTPGSERITVKHKSGSFIEIDSRGTTVNKTTGDQYDVMDRKQHVVVGGMSTVTIMGNSHVYVRGNKIEEIEGDLQTLVHGNHMLSVGGQSTHQAGEQVQIRGGDVRVHANAGTMSLNANKEMQISAGNVLAGQYGAVSIKGEKILADATDKLGLRGLTQVNIQSVAEMNLSALSMNQMTTNWMAYALGNATLQAVGTTEISGLIELAISSGTKVNLNAPVIAADVFITLANGVSRPAAPANPAAIAKLTVPPIAKAFTPLSATPEIAWYADKVLAPEPVSKSTSIIMDSEGSMGTTGYSSRDHGSDNSTNANATLSEVTAATQTAISPLLDFIGNLESEGYDDIVGLVSEASYPTKRLTRMTIQEVLDWQESIDKKYGSEASGRYQIMEDTLRGYNNDTRKGRRDKGTSLFERAGLSGGDLFSPENQDKLATVLIEARGLTKYLNGEITREQFGNNLASEWASLPLVTGPNAGRSRYAGDSAGNKSLTKVESFLSVLDLIKVRSDAAISGGAG